MSALSGAGTALLRDAISELLAQASVEECIALTPSQGKLHAKLHELGTVILDETDSQGNWLMNVRMPVSLWNSLDKHFQLNQCICEKSVEDRLAVQGKAP